MRIVIVGSGSIGMLMAFYLSKKGHNITLLTNRDEQAFRLKDKGLHIIHHDQQIEVVTVHAQTLLTYTNEESIDVAIVAVKSYQVEQVLTTLQELNVKSILFTQNGMGHTDLFPKVEKEELSVAVIEHGALRINDYTVHHTGVGQLRWSYVRKKDNDVQVMFGNREDSLFPIQYEQNWLKMLERKLIVNACINPLTALLRVKNGELVENQHHKRMLRAVFNDVMEVLKFEHHEELWVHLCEICQRTALNRSSMLSDIEHNRQTEIDSILGYLMKKADQEQYQSNLLTFLYHSVKSQEEF
ncbi:2-dehydropantoate 2-reductase [Halalkalibacter nanhaiisediminis]|uniref:2-dehydropantoate 2-reductase n=1 Tax=Halalkalibacter nanhaiisediminis TaxID=688079 RepID=A0A562QGA1_9BACI|nr:2-dehydropantoate 2-reductase [Halalkalibacter nanhaiisediminis]